MISFNFPEFQNNLIVEKHTTVQAAAEVTGYNVQYLWRLLRTGKLAGVSGERLLSRMPSSTSPMRSTPASWQGREFPDHPRITCGSKGNPMQSVQALSGMASRFNEPGLLAIPETTTASSLQLPWRACTSGPWRYLSSAATRPVI